MLMSSFAYCLIFQSKGLRNAKIIFDYLKNSDTDFYTFWSPNLQPLSVVIRNLHYTTLSSDISDALTKLGHSVRHVENIKIINYLCLYFL